MVETPASRLWIMRASFGALALVIVLLQLIPLETMPRNWAAPDILLAMTFAWSLRRPDYVPAVLIAGVMLFADLMLHRPPGLMAAFVLIASEVLKRRVLQMRDEGFLSELLLVTSMIVALTLGMRVVHSVLFIPNPPLGLTAFQTAMTLLFYPVVVLASGLLFGVRAHAPGEEATGGSRL
ncbi:rod shape-determining protein MreD [Primorskyibacter sp. S187A]|uniref:rod shape-determining protein MreD n=1 Tax=Primorskyibacter sp. S187A TaxID=3415130 RepID=UPI003C7B6315